MSAATEQPQSAPPQQTTYPVLGIFGVLLGAMLATFFGRLLSVGIGDLRGALNLDFDAASWIGTSYNMGLMFIGPFSVYLGGLLGPRPVLLTCAGIFTLTCMVLPLASHLSMTITLLVLAGLGAGSFYPLTLSFVLRNLPPKYLIYGIGAYALDIVVTTHVAHSYEAWLMRTLSWKWIFWTEAVLAPVMMLLVYFGIPGQPLPKAAPGQAKPSWRGFLYASSGATLVYAALDQGERLDWWRSSLFVALLVTGIFLFAVAAVRHFVQPNPLINFRFLRQGNTMLLAVALVFFRFVLLATVVLVPSFLATAQGYTAEQTGPVYCSGLPFPRSSPSIWRSCLTSKAGLQADPDHRLRPGRLCMPEQRSPGIHLVRQQLPHHPVDPRHRRSLCLHRPRRNHRLLSSQTPARSAEASMC